MFYIQVDIANEWQFELEFWSSWPQWNISQNNTIFCFNMMFTQQSRNISSKFITIWTRLSLNVISSTLVTTWILKF